MADLEFPSGGWGRIRSQRWGKTAHTGARKRAEARGPTLGAHLRGPFSPSLHRPAETDRV